jgi:hypothetical protein
VALTAAVLFILLKIVAQQICEAHTPKVYRLTVFGSTATNPKNASKTDAEQQDCLRFWYGKRNFTIQKPPDCFVPA